MRSHLRQMSWYFPQILLSFYMCDPKRIDITILVSVSGASTYKCPYIWSRDATAPANAPTKPTVRQSTIQRQG